MDRVVVAIDFGDTVITHDKGKEPVFYLIFELAESDVRLQVDRRNRFDLMWTLSALHDLAVAIQQLHRGNVSHNDIKPANFLTFKNQGNANRLQKLSDLGSATCPHIPSIRDDAVCAGDPRYAAPEILYARRSDSQLRTFSARRALDIYHLGSMTFYFVSGRMLTPEIIRHLQPEQRPPNEDDDWSESFETILPYWREAFGRVLDEFKAYLPRDSSGSLSKIGQALLNCVIELGEPDPRLRGHPHNRFGHSDQYSVQQYISLFNNLRRRALH